MLNNIEKRLAIYFVHPWIMNRLFIFAVGTSGKNGIMFLNEVALGKQCLIQRDDSSLKKAPQGYDSVLAEGRTEPGLYNASFTFPKLVGFIRNGCNL